MRLRDAAAEMSTGNLEARVAEDESGEIGELIRAFNQMALELQEKQRALAQSERIAAWQEIARNLAHEIKNPLTPIRTSMANLRLSMEKAPEKFPEIFLESSESILEEVEKLRQLADEFARFARLPAPNKKTANLNEVIQKNLALYNGTPVDLKFQAGDLPVFAFDASQISEVIHNLLQNAVDAVESNGMIRIDTATSNQNGRTWVQLVVEDNGKGMAEEVRNQIFTPYFTTKEKGTGLGLAIVQRIVGEHGGNILVESNPGKGTRVEIRLPA
jgi:nitrogen fixation/metabolism regulation signal transduction histidine kinase